MGIKLHNSWYPVGAPSRLVLLHFPFLKVDKPERCSRDVDNVGGALRELELKGRGCGWAVRGTWGLKAVDENEGQFCLAFIPGAASDGGDTAMCVLCGGHGR